MNKVLYIILISLFSLTIFSCAKEEEKKAPVIAEVYPVTTPTSDPSPDYTFSSTKAGTITYAMGVIVHQGQPLPLVGTTQSPLHL